MLSCLAVIDFSKLRVPVLWCGVCCVSAEVLSVVSGVCGAVKGECGTFKGVEGGEIGMSLSGSGLARVGTARAGSGSRRPDSVFCFSGIESRDCFVATHKKSAPLAGAFIDFFFKKRGCSQHWF